MSNRFFLPGTARFVALGTVAVFSVAMTPATALAAEKAPTATEAASTATMAEEIPTERVAEKTDPKYRSLFASWKSVEINTKKADPLVAAGIEPTAIPSRMPVTPTRFSSAFGMRVNPVTGRRAGHEGIDMAAPSGTPIYATADGKVEMAQWYGGYGNFVELQHDGDMETRYGHMSNINVRPGQEVKKGDLIGFVGSTGRSTGPHLHYEVRIAGEAVDPTPYLHADTFEQAFADASLGAGGPE